ncbi:MAG: relaxase/mobilization nuclease domain-containing protein [Rhizomicrobium sp.]
MIIKGKSITGPQALGPYLGNAEKNERVEVLEVKGTLAQDLVGALIEMDAYAEGTKCEKPLYHGKINPEPPYRLTPEQRSEAIDALEKKLGLEGHARVVVLHEKLGREHIHVVWTRIDLENMRAVPDSHNYRKHEEVARDLERRFDHPHVQGAHAERDGAERPDRSPSRAEMRQEERTGIKGNEVRAEVTAAFRASGGAEAFKAALEAKGYILAQGDRRDFVIVDREGGVHSLARRIEGVKAAELREFMKPVDRGNLPKAEQAKEAQLDRQQGRLSLLDQAEWDNALDKNAIKKAKEQDDDRKRRTAEGRGARKKAKVGKSYARGEDYVTQSTAALKHHKRRQKNIDKEARPQRPQAAVSHYEKIKAGETPRAEQQISGNHLSLYERMKAKASGKEVTDRMGRALDRASANSLEGEHWTDRDPDRQPEAPGGGRTRSR